MRTLLIAFALATCGAASAEPASLLAGGPAAHPARYSFVDVYRLTVSGPMAGAPLAEPAAEAPVRLAAAQAQVAEPRFSISPTRQPEKWLLALAGLALAGWVAHRRLTHAL
jgi:hypothetical protein